MIDKVKRFWKKFAKVDEIKQRKMLDSLLLLKVSDVSTVDGFGDFYALDKTILLSYLNDLIEAIEND